MFISGFAFPAHSATVSHFGYTLDTDTDIVTGGGLEWLRWDRSNNESISSHLYSNPGWRLPTTTEMVGFLGDFSPVPIPDSNNLQYSRTGGENLGGLLNVLDLMGATATPFSLENIHQQENSFVGAGVYFGGIEANGENKDGRFFLDFEFSDFGKTLTNVSFSLASGPSDFEYNAEAFETRPAQFALNERVLFSDGLGVALVRSVPELSASAAPISVLLLSSLLCLGVERRRRQKKR